MSWSRRRAVVAQDVVELRLVVALALGEALDHEHARQPEFARRRYVRARVAEMATHQSGTMPRDSSSPVSASITGIDPVRMQPAPSTTPLPTRAPSATMQREPIMLSSPTMTGAACGGSSTPPMPTPPDRCTRSPICAHEPTVAQVSTIESAPTRAPMLT